MGTLTQTDIQFVVSRIPADLLNIVKEQGLFVGGGFIRETVAGNPVQDIDVFGPTKAKLEAAAGYLQQKREGARLFKSDNAVTILAHPRVPVQFITRWCFDNADALVSSFDFTVCQAVVFFQEGRWQSQVSAAFYSDLAARRLVYTFPVREEAAGGSMLRVRKFLARGYNIQAVSLAGVIARLVAAVKVSRLAEEGEQGCAMVIAGLLHEVDPIRVIDGVDPVDEHQIAIDEGVA